MSDEVFPSLIGETYPQTRTPIHSTLIQTSVSGREIRIAQHPWPRYQWTLSFSYLSAEAALSHFQALIGFYNARHGSFDSFLFNDAYDNAVVDQPIGTGNGAQKSFQLVRTFGDSTEAVFDLNGGLIVKVGGVVNGGWTYDSKTGLITFGAAPAGDITASFAYYWRVRFVDDKADFENFVYNLFELKKIAFISTRD